MSSDTNSQDTEMHTWGAVVLELVWGPQWVQEGRHVSVWQSLHLLPKRNVFIPR